MKLSVLNMKKKFDMKENCPKKIIKSIDMKKKVQEIFKKVL